jgi:exodeoxyribonuclease VIII
MPEIITDMDAATYRATDAISASDIKWILPPKTPAHYHAYKTGQIKREETRALVIGTLCHLAVLEPDKLATAFALRPDGLDLRTKDGKAWKEAQGDKPILDGEEAAMLDGMSAAVAAHPVARKLLDGSKREVSLFSEHRTGLKLKGRIDVLGNGFVADVKTAVDGDTQNFAAAVFRYGYHVQAAMYCQLAGVERFSFIAVEKTPPFAVAVYTLSAKALQVGLNSLNYALETIALCTEAGLWPAYSVDEQTLDLPGWAYKQAEGGAQ